MDNKEYKKMSEIDNYLEEAVDNIRKDRNVAKDLLTDVIKVLQQDQTMHREIGNIAAKYVETLQRSNEQLVKVAALLQKKNNSSDSLTDKDKNELFELIQDADTN
tara:strand:- start:342 stop:656 length:315 start_codon:yes stop_codon:yes gene_type:complete